MGSDALFRHDSRVTTTAGSPQSADAEVPPTELVPNPCYWRTHSADQQAALSGALAEVGWIAEVTVNPTTGRNPELALSAKLTGNGACASLMPPT